MKEEFLKKYIEQIKDTVLEKLNGKTDNCELADLLDLKLCNKCGNWNKDKHITEIDNEFVCESCLGDLD